MRLRIGRSYWLDAHTGAVPHFAPLRGRQRADIVIVGGGVTGCSAALLFARAGATVALLEAAQIGRGSTAASTALLMQEPDADFMDLTHRYGYATTRRIWECSRAAVTAFRRTLAQVGAPGLRRVPSLYYTRDTACVAALQREAALRKRAGVPSREITRDRIAALAGFEAEAALLTTGNAAVDPYGATLALATTANARGAMLHERTAVRRIVASRDGVEVFAPRGSVAADWAVIATGYATQEFEPLRARFAMMNTYVIATRRLNAPARRQVGLGDVMLWDTGRPYHYLRWTPDHRLLFGGLDRPRLPRATRPAALRARAACLTEQLAELYPTLDNVRAEYAWEGLFATTPDGLPYIGKHRRYPRQLFALGYGGNGMTFGYLAAEILVRMAQGRAHTDDDLFGFGRARRTDGSGITDGRRRR